MVRVGMDIIVPKNSENYYNTYVIEKGDSLYKIARKYNINPELLSSMNGLDEEDYIYPGQEILIPKSGYSYYITKDGDTVDTVLKTFNTTKDNFYKYNPTIYLMAGQLLVNKTK
jgi:LysM repeat protein